MAFPKRLRYFLDRDSGLVNRVLRIVAYVIEREVYLKSKDAAEGARIGGVTFIQRFGSSLN